MRLDARNGDTGWNVYHAEFCSSVPNVLWIDDKLALWCDYAYPLVAINGQLLTEVHAAKRIRIIASSRLAIINPIEDEDEAQEFVDAITGMA